MSVTIESKGKLPDVNLAKKAILARATQNIRSLAIQKAPYDTGLLRKSIGSRVTPHYGKVGVDKNIPYARRVEFGTKFGPIQVKGHYKKIKGKMVYVRPYSVQKQKAHLYLTNAYEKVRDELDGIIAAEIAKTTK